MNLEEKYELFERYCNQEISSSEQQQLDELIKEDTSVKEEFRLYQEANEHLKVNFSAQKVELEKSITEIGSSYFKSESINKETKVIRIPIWGYAAAASVVIILVVYLFMPQQPVYTDYASIDTWSLTERGDQEVLSKRTEELFNAKRYEEAEQSITQLMKIDNENAEYQFYYGIVLLEQNKYNKATQVFEKLQEGSSVYKYNALWYEALNQLKQEQYDQCSKLLKSIPEEAEDYGQAQNLLGKLKR